MMARLSILTAALSLALAVAPAQAGDACKYLPGNTEIVLTVNVKQLVEAPLVQKHFLEKAKAEFQKDEAQQVLKALGLDPFKDVYRVVTALPPLGANPNSDKTVLIVEGRFDVNKIEAFAADAAKASPKVAIEKTENGKVYELKEAWEKKKTLWAAVADSSTLVASPTKELVTEALGRKTSPVELKPDVRKLVENGDDSESISLVILASALGKGTVAAPQAKELLAKMVNVTGGVTVGEDIKIGINVACKDGDAAQEMGRNLKQGLDVAGVLVAGNPQLMPVADVLTTVKVNPKGTDVQVKALISKEVVEKAIQSVQQK